MICKKCKKENVNYAKFCMYCGYQLKKIHIFRYIFLSLFMIIFTYFSFFYVLKIYRSIYEYSDIKAKEKVLFDYNNETNFFRIEDHTKKNIFKFSLGFNKYDSFWINEDYNRYSIDLDKNKNIQVHFGYKFPIDHKKKTIDLFVNNNLIKENIFFSANFYIGNDYYGLKLNKKNQKYDIYKNFKLESENNEITNFLKIKDKTYFLMKDINNIFHLYKDLKKVSDGRNVKKFIYSELYNKILIYYDNEIKTIDGEILLKEKIEKEFIKNESYIKKIFLKDNPDMEYYRKSGSLPYFSKKLRYNEYRDNNSKLLFCEYGANIFINKTAKFYDKLLEMKTQNVKFNKYKSDGILILEYDDVILYNTDLINIPLEDRNIFYYTTFSNDYTSILKIYKKKQADEYDLAKIIRYDLNNNKYQRNNIQNYNDFKINKGLSVTDIFEVKPFKNKKFLINYKNYDHDSKLYLDDFFLFKTKKRGDLEIINKDNYVIEYKGFIAYDFYLINGKKEQNSFYGLNEIKFNNKNDYIYSAKIKDKWHFVLNGEIIERGYDFINYVKYIEEKDSFYAFACDDDKLYLVEIPIGEINKNEM